MTSLAITATMIYTLVMKETAKLIIAIAPVVIMFILSPVLAAALVGATAIVILAVLRHYYHRGGVAVNGRVYRSN